MSRHATAAIIILLAGAVALLGRAAAQTCGPPESGPGLCPASTGADVIVGDIPDIARWGTLGDITAYSIGTTACNFGDTPLNWQPLNANHPVVAQNMYRMNAQRIEQIGMSWVKHGFTVFQDLCCCADCTDTGSFELLGVGCSDTYNAPLNGGQAGFNGRAGLGPRSDINPATGAFPFPYTTQGEEGDVLYKRMQVHHDDLDPALHPDAQYFVEAQYITPDEAMSPNRHNSVAWRPVTVGPPHPEGGWDLSIDGITTPLESAIHAWAHHDPAVQIATVDVPDDGRFILGWKVTDNGDGTWRYEYALHNLNSHRAAQRFHVPDVAAIVTGSAGFHDIEHHSGEPYDTTDWSFAINSGASWQCADYATDPDANALRWGTLYNFWFDAPAPPIARSVEIHLFRPGAPELVTAAAAGPSAGPVECSADIAGDDDLVNVLDLLELLSNWDTFGPGATLAAPISTVDVLDLLELLGAWGPC